MPASKVLIVEDDDSIADFLTVTLKTRGFEVHRVADGALAMATFAATQPDIVLLDLNLPGVEGSEILKQIRHSSQTPVIVVSVRDDEIDKVCALEVGADDYVTKPFSARELVARIRTNLRGRESRNEESRIGPLAINWRRAEITKAGVKVILSAQEFDFLHLLFRHKDRVLSRSFLIESVWGYDYEGDERVVDTTVKRLRRKVGPDLIETVRGRGYRLRV